jgi:para-aminobenzoate synthetase component I
MKAKDEAISLMNRYGKEQVPFLFIIDYELQKPEIIPFYEIDGNEILFNINNFNNSIQKRDNKPDFSFEKHPVDYPTYKTAFDCVMVNINKGNTYLANLTFPAEVKTSLSLKEIFLYSKARYKLFFRNKFVVFSPETFIHIHNRYIASFPMKGTIDASVENAEQKLLNDPKEEAEHATIVDLIRNDLSIVAKNVEVKRYRYIDTLETNQKKLLQTSSEVAGILPENFQENIGTVLFSMLPAGSISGAPKNKTLEVIRDAEKNPRGYFTGVFGYFDGIHLESAVMIRYIEHKDKKLIYRSGGGITSASDPKTEYQEMIDKVYVPVY